MMLDHLTVFGAISFVNFLLTFFLASFAYSKNKKKPINVAYALFAFSLSFYAFFYFLWQSSSGIEYSILFFKLCIIGVVLINTALVRFVAVILNVYDKYKKIIFAIHGIDLFFCFAAGFLFYDAWKVKFNFGLWPVPSKLFAAYLTWWFFQVFSCFAWLYSQGIKKSFGKQRKQYFWVLLASCIGYIGGATNWFVWYGIKVPPYANGFIAVYALMLAYAILRHQLFDIEVIIKKTLVFAGVFGMVMAIISLVTTVSQSVIGQFVRVPNTVSTAVSMLLAIFLYDPTRRFLIKSTDKFLFQKKEDIRVILNRLSKEIITILDLREVGRKVLNTLEDTLRLEASALIVMNDQKQRFEILNSFNLDDDWVFWSQKDPLIQFFSQHFDILNIEEASTREKLPEDLKAQLVSLKASIILPLVIQNSLIGLLILGKKKSDQEFDSQELDYFPTIASQIAISISNAKLLEEVVSERESKFKAEKEAEMVSYAKTIAHEIKNALVGIANPAMFLSYYQLPDLRIMFEKYIKPNAPEPAQKKYLDICAKIEHQTQTIKNSAEKIRVIAKTAEGTLKNDETSKEELYFRIIWDEAKSDSRVKDVFFSSKLPENFVLVGNLVLLQRVFVNLITNAREAMKEDQAEKKIHLECSYKDVEGKKAAWFEFQDNGPGIPKELQERIFEQGFSTKPKPKKGDINASGYGQGLYVIKKTIEDFHHGKLMLESEVGKGTKFIFWIPAEPEVAAV